MDYPLSIFNMLITIFYYTVASVQAANAYIIVGYLTERNS
jgi:hypothetical protein